MWTPICYNALSLYQQFWELFVISAFLQTHKFSCLTSQSLIVITGKALLRTAVASF